MPCNMELLLKSGPLSGGSLFVTKGYCWKGDEP
nr:MAG TPA: hypothetical protein [Caudoviricetes sp.]